MQWQAPRRDGEPDRRVVRIVGVIVTMNRPRELDRLLRAIALQHHRPDRVIVVENLPRHETAAALAQHPDISHVTSERNLGGAGGFALGILTALAEGATHVWLMDDDGLPQDADCLGQLVHASEQHAADVVAPVILDIEDESRLAFPYFLEGRRITTRAGLRDVPIVRQFAHLFNGALVTAETFLRFGIPDFRLFVRGDEVDFLHRVRRGGGRIVTLTGAGFCHPSGAGETVPIIRDRLHAVMPPDPVRQCYFFRNRGYLVRRHRLLSQALHDVLRYGLLFLVVRGGDWRGFRRWWRLTMAGMRENFVPVEHLEAPGLRPLVVPATRSKPTTPIS